MTEYDFSPEAYEKYLATQTRVSNWVSDQVSRGPRYADPRVPPSNPPSVVPSTRSRPARSKTQPQLQPLHIPESRSPPRTSPPKSSSGSRRSHTSPPPPLPQPQKARYVSPSRDIRPRPAPARSRTLPMAHAQHPAHEASASRPHHAAPPPPQPIPYPPPITFPPAPMLNLPPAPPGHSAVYRAYPYDGSGRQIVLPPPRPGQTYVIVPPHRGAVQVVVTRRRCPLTHGLPLSRWEQHAQPDQQQQEGRAVPPAPPRLDQPDRGRVQLRARRPRAGGPAAAPPTTLDEPFLTAQSGQRPPAAPRGPGSALGRGFPLRLGIVARPGLRSFCPTLEVARIADIGAIAAAPIASIRALKNIAPCVRIALRKLGAHSPPEELWTVSPSSPAGYQLCRGDFELCSSNCRDPEGEVSPPGHEIGIAVADRGVRESCITAVDKLATNTTNTDASASTEVRAADSSGARLRLACLHLCAEIPQTTRDDTSSAWRRSRVSGTLPPYGALAATGLQQELIFERLEAPECTRCRRTWRTRAKHLHSSFALTIPGSTVTNAHSKAVPVVCTPASLDLAPRATPPTPYTEGPAEYERRVRTSGRAMCTATDPETAEYAYGPAERQALYSKTAKVAGASGRAVGAHVFQSYAPSAQSSEVTSFLYAQLSLLAERAELSSGLLALTLYQSASSAASSASLPHRGSSPGGTSEHADRHSGLDPETWKSYLEQASERQKQYVDQFNSQMDMLLLFAALFSAIVTAFVVVSYATLQPDLGQSTLQVLQEILVTLRSNESSSQDTQVPVSEPFTPAHSAIRVNMYWFIALVLSLCTAFLAILAKQWLLSLSGSLSADMETRGRQQQFRWDGVKDWQLSYIMAVLPLMLHISLALFFVGLVEFIWPVNTMIAIAVACLSGATVLFYVLTHILSILSPTCPYRTSTTDLVSCTFNMLAQEFLVNSMTAVIIVGLCSILALMSPFVAAALVVSWVRRHTDNDRPEHERALRTTLQDLRRLVRFIGGPSRWRRATQSIWTWQASPMLSLRSAERDYIGDNSTLIDAHALARMIGEFPRSEDSSALVKQLVDFGPLRERRSVFTRCGAVALLAQQLHSALAETTTVEPAQHAETLRISDALVQLLTEADADDRYTLLPAFDDVPVHHDLVLAIGTEYDYDVGAALGSVSQKQSIPPLALTTRIVSTYSCIARSHTIEGRDPNIPQLDIEHMTASLLGLAHHLFEHAGDIPSVDQSTMIHVTIGAVCAIGSVLQTCTTDGAQSSTAMFRSGQAGEPHTDSGVYLFEVPRPVAIEGVTSEHIADACAALLRSASYAPATDKTPRHQDILLSMIADLPTRFEKSASVTQLLAYLRDPARSVATSLQRILQCTREYDQGPIVAALTAVRSPVPETAVQS
ncbi:predicted protein [Postia placenta Mad-698-R]|uniref:DUF6535 domain-containing protein n=1 Tax=Postia placenta MAD-698-R-SB12 TaxID=670580 RepID=A0A1X6MXM2_9APHY|nr:hypothetical protein POSPLADRAFT_1047389 [Postia placenta MAD-698-R-SB12]EED85679.1 predicted protein [Postia placenta Mad-698-R]OSX61124.1 hypothetical protein POSPLADRAFT_1047389 [Postia placenta MAD-698-R-SB12]